MGRVDSQKSSGAVSTLRLQRTCGTRFLILGLNVYLLGTIGLITSARCMFQNAGGLGNLCGLRGSSASYFSSINFN